MGERQSPFEAADQTPALTGFVSAALQALRKVNVCSQKLRLLCAFGFELKQQIYLKTDQFSSLTL